MSYSITCSTKILILAIYFSWRLMRICYGAMWVHFTVPSGREGALRTQMYGTHSAEHSSNRFKPFSVMIFLWQGHC